MAVNRCKYKMCEKEIPVNDKYCIYHNKQRKKKLEKAIKGTAGVVTVVGMAILVNNET